MNNVRINREIWWACAVVFAVGVVGTVYFCHSMGGGMTMPGGWTMSMTWMRMSGQTWVASATMFLLMWLVMMVAMMLPSALPVLLDNGSPSGSSGNILPILPVILATGGYFFVWLLIGLIVYVAGAVLAAEAMHSDAISRAEPVLAGLALVISGCFQFTRWKMAGLRRCRCGLGGTQRGTGWRYGMKQGVSCAVCCSSLTTVLLVLGIMNPVVMLVVAVAITMEKLLPKPEPIVWISGTGMVAMGAMTILKVAV